MSKQSPRYDLIGHTLHNLIEFYSDGTINNVKDLINVDDEFTKNRPNLVVV